MGTEMKCFARKAGKDAVPLVLVTATGFEDWKAELPGAEQAWLDANDFKPRPGAALLVPALSGAPAYAVVAVEEDGTGESPDYWSLAAAYKALPKGRYALPADTPGPQATAAALGWALASYRFTRYKPSAKAEEKDGSILVLTQEVDRSFVENLARSMALARDLITTPASDMGPAELADTAKALAAEHKAKFKCVTGEALLKQGFPMIHAVGRASVRAPRLIDFTWGDAKAPKVTLIGKGVCFDSGGLDLKPAAGMMMMKKDMGGAAIVLGLARMIMASKLKVRLRVLIPAVENSVSGDAFRPLDVLDSRKGLTVEIGNTDAEGRLVLADALTLALEDEPDLMLDFATLTGAARVAVGTEISAFFSNSDALAADLEDGAEAMADPVWRLPLHKPYRRMLDSKVASLNNISNGPFGGAITAALFLEEFVTPASKDHDDGDDAPTAPEWAHFDIMAWNQRPRPGRPEGGEAMGLRAAYAAIRKRYG